MDSHNLQPQELNNRIKIYSQKLAQQWNSINDPSNLPSGRLHLSFQQNGKFTKKKIIFF